MADTSPRKKTKGELQSILKKRIVNSVGYLDGSIANDRRNATELYEGRTGSKTPQGRSSVRSYTTFDVIENLAPKIARVFMSPDLIQVQPVSEEDEEQSEQQSDVANYLIFGNQSSFDLIQGIIRSSLLYKNAYVKVFNDVDTSPVEQEIKGIDIQQLLELRTDRYVEFVEDAVPHVSDALEGEEAGEAEEDAKLLWDVKIERRKPTELRIELMPYEEVLIQKAVKDVNTDDQFVFWAHRSSKTRNQLIAEGYNKELVYSLPSYNEFDYDQDRNKRFSQTDNWASPEDGAEDRATDEIMIYECHYKTDLNGDGDAQWYKIIMAGPGPDMIKSAEESGEKGSIQFKVMDDTDAEDWAVPEADHGLVSFCPIKFPHREIGTSIPDVMGQEHLVIETVRRQLLDNTYQINNNRTAHNARVQSENLMNNVQGQVIPVDGDEPVPGAIMALTNVPIINECLAVLQHEQDVIENRVGLSNTAATPDVVAGSPNALNMALGEEAERSMFMAMSLGTGFVELAKKVLSCLVARQERELTIRIRNKWVQIDPRPWNLQKDIHINISVLAGTPQYQAQVAQSLLETQLRVAAEQESLDGPFVTPKQIAQTLHMMTSAMGQTATELYWNSPEDAEQSYFMQKQQRQQQPQPQDPFTLQAQVEQQRNQMKHQENMRSMTFEQQMKVMQQQFDQQMAVMQARSKEQIEYLKAALEDQRKRAEQVSDAELEARGQDQKSALSIRGQNIEAIEDFRERSLRAATEAFTNGLSGINDEPQQGV